MKANDLPLDSMPAAAKPKTGGFATRAIHWGYNPADHHGALVPPTYGTSTFAFPDVAYGPRCFTGTKPG